MHHFLASPAYAVRGSKPSALNDILYMFRKDISRQAAERSLKTGARRLIKIQALYAPAEDVLSCANLHQMYIYS